MAATVPDEVPQLCCWLPGTKVNHGNASGVLPPSCRGCGWLHMDNSKMPHVEYVASRIVTPGVNSAGFRTNPVGALWHSEVDSFVQRCARGVGLRLRRQWWRVVQMKSPF